MHGLTALGGAVELFLLADGEQPGADMFGQHDDGTFVEHALVTGVIEVGGQLQAQAREALIVGGEQFRLDAQQVAACAGLADIERDLAAQVGQVMAAGALHDPVGVAAKTGQQCEREQKGDQ